MCLASCAHFCVKTLHLLCASSEKCLQPLGHSERRYMGNYNICMYNREKCVHMWMSKMTLMVVCWEFSVQRERIQLCMFLCDSERKWPCELVLKGILPFSERKWPCELVLKGILPFCLQGHFCSVKKSWLNKMHITALCFIYKVAINTGGLTKWLTFLLWRWCVWWRDGGGGDMCFWGWWLGL